MRILTLLAVVACLSIYGCGSSGGGGGSGGSKSSVTLLSSRAALTKASGAADVGAGALFDTLGGQIMLTDLVSGGLLAILDDGSVFLFTSQADLKAAAGGASATLGPLAQVSLGQLAGQLLAADAVSGNLLRIDVNGNPFVFSSKAIITAVTSQANALMSLPHEVTQNQIAAQDLVSKAILRFDPQGNAFPMVSAIALAQAAGVTEADAVVAGWIQGPVSLTLYARFATTNNLVRLQVNGQVARHVNGSDLAAAFPDIAGLRVLDFAPDTDSDAFLVLLGEGTKGVAIALITSAGDISVFVSKSFVRQAAGDTVNLSDLIVLPTGVPIAVDHGGAQVLTFGSGKASVVATTSAIMEASGSAAPVLSLGAGLLDGTAAIFETQSQSMLRIQ